jgi:predicted nucleotide-binding protein (sugar kinase/HSP70/actin superfamily)
VENTKVDYILVPRISYYGDRLFTCTKFRTCPDVIINFNILKDKKMLTYNIDTKRGINELDAYKALGQDLNKTEEEILEAYKFAREIIENTTKEKSIKFNTLLNLKTNKIKILVVGHSYNTLDAYIGKPITDYLYKAGCIVLFSEDYDPDLAKETAKRELPTLRYENSQRQFGAAYDAQNNIDGIILITAFPCGPDSMTNDMIIRRIKSVPIIQLIVDEQEGSAGRETRLESFLDIINFKHKKYECS